MLQLRPDVATFNDHNVTFWSKFSVFLSAVTLKIRSRLQILIRALECESVVSTQILVKIKLLVQDILNILLFFGLNLACFCLQ